MNAKDHLIKIALSVIPEDANHTVIEDDGYSGSTKIRIFWYTQDDHDRKSTKSRTLFLA